MSLSICHTCDRMCFRAHGLAVCRESGEDIIVMQRRGCPLGKFSPQWPTQPIPADYVPTPKNATEGGCGCKK